MADWIWGGKTGRRSYKTPEESFLARTSKKGGCIVWTGAISSSGYGSIWDGKRVVQAHRYAWERVHGPIPAGMFVDHMCFAKECVNVDHLRLATPSGNSQNIRGAKSNSKTGIRGVSYHKSTGKWSATAQVEGKSIYELHNTIEEAEEAAIRLRREHLPYSQEVHQIG